MLIKSETPDNFDKKMIAFMGDACAISNRITERTSE
jgi:hypothetical protein